MSGRAPLGARFRPPACTRFRIALLIAALSLGALTLRAEALTPESTEEVTAPSESEKRARQLRELMGGALDPAVDPRGLFKLDLGSPALAKLLREWAPPTKPTGSRRRNERAPANDEAPTPDSALAFELARFLNLPTAQRERLLRQHRERQAEAQAAQAARERLEFRLEQATLRAAQLDAFLKKALPPEIDPTSLLSLELLDPDDVGLDAARRGRIRPLKIEPEADADADADAKAGPATSTAAAGPEAPLPRRVDEAEARLDVVRARYLALSTAQRDELMQAHAAQRSAAGAVLQPSAEVAEQLSAAETLARSAAEERTEALDTARRAHSEALRAVAEERARLLGIREQQARFAGVLATRRQELEQHRETALSWTRRVRELTGRSLLDARREIDAGRSYAELVKSLTDERAALHAALDEVRWGPSAVPSPGELTHLPDHVDTSDIAALGQELQTERKRLLRELGSVRWEAATTLRDGVVTMNHERLTLLEHLSGARRDALRGFGAEGVGQARRELEQITLEARFHLLALPHAGRAQLHELAVSPIPVLFALLELSLVIAAFRWWRKRASALLLRLQEAWATKRPQTATTRRLAGAAWYLERIRKPIEWLVLSAVLVNSVAMVRDLPEIRYVWIVVLWVLLGNLCIQFFNAIAARQSVRDETEALRYRSLRLVGIGIVLVGLVLGLTEQSVGRGAIYGWVLSTCWLLAIPVLLLLISWWRPTVLARARDRHDPSPIIAWAAGKSTGPVSFVASALAGAYLLGDGLYRFALRHAAHLQVTQRLLAYLFRREVEKRAEAETSERSYEPLPQSVHDGLRAETPALGWVESVAQKQVGIVRDLIASENDAVVGVIGERGLGKTSFLKRATAELTEREAIRVACEPEGFTAFLRAMARHLDLPPNADGDAIVHALQQRSPKVVCVDDAQRLIRPLIGGLRDIELLTELAHSVGGTTAWVIAIGAPGWHYLRRARGDRAIFDEVVMLEPWSEAEIAALTKARTTAIELDARYDDLLAPRQIDVSNYGTTTEHTARDYTRILWDYAKGNPAVALHFFGQSLGLRDGAYYVRLFKPPTASELEELPSSIYFVLRTIVQLGLALEGDVVECTGLRPADVADALRLARSRRYVERVEDRIRITLPWYRAITQVLQRQHLLIK